MKWDYDCEHDWEKFFGPYRIWASNKIEIHGDGPPDAPWYEDYVCKKCGENKTICVPDPWG